MPAPDDPSEKPYPGYAREKAALDAKVLAAESAAAGPLPGPLREAFAGDPPSVHGFSLQPVKMGLHVMLVKIGSPLLDVVKILREELTREDGVDVSTPALSAAARQARLARANDRIAAMEADAEGLIETVFCFVRPLAALRKLWAAGRPAFREAAHAAIGDALTAGQFADLQRAVSAHYAASFATVVKYEAPKGEGDGTVFSGPPAEMTTASAGGSRSSGS